MAYAAVLDWTEEHAQLLEDLLDEDGDFLSGTEYSRRKRKHVISAVASRVSLGGSLKLAISVDYEASMAAQDWVVPPGFKKESIFLSRIEQLHGPCEFQCRVRFEFADKDADDLWFPLPTPLGGDDQESALYEIRGVEAVRMSGNNSDQIEFRFNLRRPSNEKTYVSLYFTLLEDFDDELPERILAQATQIVRELVRR